MFHNIVVASDLSERSERALRRGLRLATQHGATLTVMSVVDGELPMAMAERMAEATESALAAICAEISAHPVQIRVEIGDPVGAMLECIKDLDADLLCLGEHRPRAFWDLFSGTTMERLVRATNCPVLLVTAPVKEAYKHILCGIDLSPASAEALRRSCALAPRAAVSTFHAVHVPYRGLLARKENAEHMMPLLQEAAEHLHDWWSKADMPEQVVEPVPLALGRGDALAEALEKISPDLLAVGAHGRSAMAPTMLGSFTEKLLREPPCDLLVVRG